MNALPLKDISMPGHSSRVYQSLCRSLADGPETVNWAAFTRSEWRQFAPLAVHEGVAPLFFSALNRANVPTFRASTFKALTEAYYQSSAQNALLYSELARILTILNSAAIPAVVLKGADLAVTVYPERSLRPMLDIDLLVRHGDLARSMQIVRELAYVEAPAQTAGFEQAAGHHVHVRGGPGNQVILEVHWDLVAGPADWRSVPVDWFWRRTRSWNPVTLAPDLSGQGLQLDPTAHLLYLAAHLVLQHSGVESRLLWYYDLHLMIRRFQAEIDWDALAERARSFGWGTATRLALSGAQKRFGTRVPEGFWERIGNERDGRTLSLIDHKAAGNLSQPQRDWNRLSYLNPVARLRTAVALTFPSPTYMRWRYSPRPPWLWPLYYPYRWSKMLRAGLGTLPTFLRSTR